MGQCEISMLLSSCFKTTLSVPLHLPSFHKPSPHLPKCANSPYRSRWSQTQVAALGQFSYLSTCRYGMGPGQRKGGAASSRQRQRQRGGVPRQATHASPRQTASRSRTKSLNEPQSNAAPRGPKRFFKPMVAWLCFESNFPHLAV